jgi:Flp pilus assembly protein TadD
LQGDALVEKGSLAGGIAKLCTVCLRLELCDALVNKGDLEGAIAEYRIVIRLQPDDFSAHLGLGLALATKGDLEGAIAEFRTAIHLQSDDADAPCFHIGDALVEKGNLDGVIAEFRTAIRLRSNDDLAHLGLGLALEMKGDRLGALDEIEKVRERFPTDSMIAEAYERIRRKAGNG